MVGFSDKQRIMGVGAKNQLLTNLKKTVFGFKHMLGRKFKDPYVQEAIKGLPYDISEGSQGEVRVQLNYMDKSRAYTPEEITAMLLTKLKDTVSNYCQLLTIDSATFMILQNALKSIAPIRVIC